MDIPDIIIFNDERYINEQPVEKETLGDMIFTLNWKI